MSVLSKIKNMVETVEEFPKEKAKITLTENSCADIENYKLLKVFDSEKVMITFDTFEVCIYGQNMIVEYFSPSRLVISGTLKSVSYMWDILSDKEVI